MFVCCLLHFAAIKPQLRQQLKNEEVEVGGTAKLRCELSISKAEVEWRKDGVLLQSSSKYEMWQHGTLRELRVHHLEPSDAGEYSCKAGDETTSAKLTVKGKRCFLGQGDFHFKLLRFYNIVDPIVINAHRVQEGHHEVV